jgi:hypothetical protein
MTHLSPRGVDDNLVGQRGVGGDEEAAVRCPVYGGDVVAPTLELGQLPERHCGVHSVKGITTDKLCYFRNVKILHSSFYFHIKASAICRLILLSNIMKD